MYEYIPAITPDEIYHHGILGQKWGKRNGPPYPLGVSDHSASERKAGWKKSLDGKNKKEYNRSAKADRTSSDSNKTKTHNGLTDKQKRVIKTGATVVAMTLAVSGGIYLAKSGKLNKLIEFGKDHIGSQFDGIDLNGFKRIVGEHGIKDDMSKVNPLFSDKNSVGYNKNCISCSVAYELRRRGFDVRAKPNAAIDPTSGKSISKGLGKIKYIEESFENYSKNTRRMSVKEFSDLDRYLTKYYPDGSRGVINFKRIRRKGHSICWEVKNNRLFFIDSQCNTVYSTSSRLFNMQKFSKRDIHITRLDDLDLLLEGVKNIVDYN